MTRIRYTLSTRPKKKTNCQKKKTGGLHLDRFGRGGGGVICWLCLITTLANISTSTSTKYVTITILYAITNHFHHDNMTQA